MASLWTFSLALYAQPEVAPACLRCQDEAGADVNLVLFLLWQAGAGARHTAASIAAIDRDVREWREQAVQPLRAVRRFLRGREQDRLRDLVEAAELEAERIEQDRLCHHARPGAAAAAPETAHANLQAYETVLGHILPPDAVATLLAALGRQEARP